MKQLITSITSKKRLRAFINIFAQLFVFTIFAGLLIPVVLAVGLDKLMPRVFFNLITLALLVLIPAGIAHILSIFITKQPRKVSEEKPLSPKAKKLLYIFIGLIVIGTSIGVGVRKFSENSTLTNAEERFLVNINGLVTEQRKDSTLIELETQLERLIDKYSVLGLNTSIRIELYPDIESIHAHNVMPSWGDAFITYESGIPIIHLPAESQGGSLYKSAQTVTPKPSHEITHFVIHAKIGPDFRKVLPLWLDEGIAQYESHRGLINLYRMNKRLVLWLFNLYEPSLLKDSQFILSSATYPDTNVWVYYYTCFEFIRYIDSNYSGSVQHIVNRIANGEKLSEAFIDEIGESIEDLYNKWYEDFF